MKKKVLIIYAPYGSGHKSIAEYINEAFLEPNEYEVKLLDVAKYAKLLGKFSIKAFDMVIKHRTNHLFSFFYDITNNKLSSKPQSVVMKKSFDNPKMREEIISFQPDLTISTHFFGSAIVAYYNKLGFINSKIMTVITDYDTHSYWEKNHENQDAFIVANELVKNKMVKSGVDEAKIYPFGLPFNRRKEENLIAKSDILLRYNLDRDQNTYLFFGGGQAGSMANYEYFKALLRMKLPLNLIFVSGRNQHLEEKCRQYVIKNNIENVKVLGFTKEVLSLLNASDVCITKPGGATITECIDMKVPMILIPGNGGPEKYNARFVKKKHYGIVTKNWFKMCRAIKKIERNELVLKSLKKSLQKEKPNDSVARIYKLSQKLLK